MVMEDLILSTILIIVSIKLQVLTCSCFTSFVFGDSLVDAGNNNYLVSLSKADTSPYGIDFAPSGGHPTGRFTNGRTISDIIGEGLGAKSYPPPFLAPKAASDAIFNKIGINYASGAAGILDSTGTLFIGRLPLKDQVSNFAKTRQDFVDAMGVENTTNLFKNAIFSLTVGSNDVINYFQPSLLPFLPHNDVPSNIFQDFMVSNLTFQLKRLHAYGARKFVVVGIGPLGCIPFIRATNLIPTGQCSTEVNSLVRGYNEKLKVEIDQMNKQMQPNAVFVYANSYDIFREIILNYRNYGFEDNEGPCCGGYFPPLICYNSSRWLCGDRRKYVFWDAYHPTEAANLVTADKLLNGDTTMTSPMNIRHLYNYDFH